MFVRFDFRENVMNSILTLRSMPYYPYKWSEMFKLCKMLGDDAIIKGLDKRIKDIEKKLNMRLVQAEANFAVSNYLDNFFLVKGKKITELEVYYWLNDIDDWLVNELVRVQKTIRYSRPPKMP